jgi:hypothetical protein
MSKPITVRHDALRGDCAPVRLGAAGARPIVAAVCTLGTESASLARQVDQHVDIEATLTLQQRALRCVAAEARLRSDDERWLFAPCAAVGVS